MAGFKVITEGMAIEFVDGHISQRESLYAHRVISPVENTALILHF
jgi:hypothetical protein